MVCAEIRDDEPEDNKKGEQPEDDEQELRTDDVLLTPAEACEFIGGPTKPIDPSNLYRGVKSGRYRGPVHPLPGVSRFVQRWLANDRNRNIKGGR